MFHPSGKTGEEKKKKAKLTVYVPQFKYCKW